MCLIFLIALSIYAASRPQKDIKISPEQKFKLWLNDTIKHINGKYSISSDSTLLTVTDSFSYIVKKGEKQLTLPIGITQKLYKRCWGMLMNLLV